MEIVRYKYDIEILYDLNGKLITIDGDHIDNLLIDYDYDNKNMPIMFARISIDKNLFDDIIKNSEKKKMTVYIYKYVIDSAIQIKELYLQETLKYFTDENLNNSKEIDYNDTTKDNKDMFKKITIGLMKQELIDNNKVITDGYFNGNKNTILATVLAQNNKLLMEPVTNNTSGQLYFPTIDTLTKFVTYFDKNYTIYDSPYRLFYDYDNTYLLSSKGNFIEKNNDTYGTVIININKVLSDESKVQGMQIDKTNRSYIIELDEKDVKDYQDKTTGVSYNNVLVIGPEGSTSNSRINTSSTGSSTNTKVIRANSLSEARRQARDVQANNLALSFDKNDLDTSVLTMNKQYLVKDYKDNKRCKFILTQKKEIYVRENKDFILNVVISLKKVDE